MIAIPREDVYAMMGFILVGVIMFCQLGAVIDIQNAAITEYCVHHPTETITGDMVINCSEWLVDHPELVAEYEQALLLEET
jgi:hypothetical protein